MLTATAARAPFMLALFSGVFCRVFVKGLFASLAAEIVGFTFIL